MKKGLLLLLFSILTLSIVACKPPVVDHDKPVISGVENVSVVIDSSFDPLAGVTAVDYNGNVLTSSIVVTGSVDITKGGTYQVTYSVTDADNFTTTATRTVTVLAYSLAQYPNGVELGKLLGTEKAKLFAAAENYLLENVYGGVPLYAGASAVVYSDRVQLFSENYNGVLGFGTAFSTLTEDDSHVVMDADNHKGNVGEYTWRSSYVTDPTGLVNWYTDDANSSDFIDTWTGGLYDFYFDDTKEGYEINPSLAAADPIAVGGKTENGRVYSTKWQIKIKTGLTFFYHPSIAATIPAEWKVLDANDWVNTWKYALNHSYFRSYTGGGDLVSAKVKGVSAYQQNPTEALWEASGIKLIDNNTFELEFTVEKSTFDIKYLLAGSVQSPLPLEYVASLGGTAKDGGTFGTSPETVVSTGVYYFDTWQKGQLITVKKNPEFVEKDLYHYTGQQYRQIATQALVYEEFKKGTLESVSVPSVSLADFAGSPKLKKAPDATTWRLMINGFGSQAAQLKASETYALGLDDEFIPEPILQYLEMRNAIMFGVDRNYLANTVVLGTRLPYVGLFQPTYFIDAESGLGVRGTAAGQAVIDNYSPETGGYVPDYATAQFVAAVAKGIAAGDYSAGTASNYEVITFDFRWASSGNTTGIAYVTALESQLEGILIDNVHYVKVDIVVTDVPFPDNYYDYMMIANCDLGLGGISGSLLDAPSFLDVFSEDNRGGFTLNWGIDTTTANIPVEYYDINNVLRVETWSFDALVSALNGKIYVVDGKEQKAFDNADAALKVYLELNGYATEGYATVAATEDLIDAFFSAADIEELQSLFTLARIEFTQVTLADGAKLLVPFGVDLSGKYSIITIHVYGLSEFTPAGIKAAVTQFLSAGYGITPEAVILITDEVYAKAVAYGEADNPAEDADSLIVLNNIKYLVAAAKLGAIPATWAELSEAIGLEEGDYLAAISRGGGKNFDPVVFAYYPGTIYIYAYYWF